MAIRTNALGQTERWKRQTPELVTKSVCKKCNEGWMSDLEQTTEPIFRQMIYGQQVSLTPAQQLIITQWMIKCAMVLGSMSSDAIFYEKSECFHFRETLLPPGYLTFWLGHYSGSDRNGFTSHRIISNGRSVPQYRSNILTMSFGYLVIQMSNTKLLAPATSLAVNLPIKKGNWSLVEFGPHLRNSIQWPPPGPSLDDSERTLKTFSKRFGDPRRK